MAESLIPEYTDNVARDLEHRREAVRKKLLQAYGLDDKAFTSAPQYNDFRRKIKEVLETQQSWNLGESGYGKFSMKLQDYAGFSRSQLSKGEIESIRAAATRHMQHYADVFFLIDQASHSPPPDLTQQRFSHLKPDKEKEMREGMAQMCIAQITLEALSKLKSYGFNDGSTLRLVGALIGKTMGACRDLKLPISKVQPQFVARESTEAETLEKIYKITPEQRKIIRDCYDKVPPLLGQAR